MRASSADHLQRARVQPQGPEFVFRIEADAAAADAGVLRVHAITIERADGTGDVQRIDGLDTDTPVAPNLPALEFVDMNFDGFADLRIIESRPAGPTLPYRNWLFDPASGRFVASPALDALSAPRFDGAREEVVADWRDGAARYGTDTHAWRDGSLLPLRRKLRTYQRPGVYTETTARWSDASWKEVERHQGQDRP
ncbi:MAG: hypothetical protein ABIN96_04885 [Rubrivivax sp.]